MRDWSNLQSCQIGDTHKPVNQPVAYLIYDFWHFEVIPGGPLDLKGRLRTRLKM